MGALSDYAEGKIIDHIFRTNSFTKPTVLAVALCANVPVDADTGTLTVGQELANAGAYARQSLNPSDANWSPPNNGNGTTGNSGTITFPVATANWGWISGMAICDSATYGAGNSIVYGALQTPKLISTGDQYKFNISDILFSID